MAVEPSTLLPCGRDPLDVVDAARRGRPDAHTRGCQYCQAVLADDARQREIADELRAVATPAPASLLTSVMATVWAELRPGRQIPLPTAEPAFATELAVSSMLQRGLDELDDLEIQVCEVHLDEAATGDDAGSLDVDVTAAAAYPADLLRKADDIRVRVREVLATQFHLRARTIDVSFDDLYDDRGA